MFLVTPGSLEDSYLWHKLRNTHTDVGGSGLGMPTALFGDYEPLPEADIVTIETWILEGAYGDDLINNTDNSENNSDNPETPEEPESPENEESDEPTQESTVDYSEVQGIYNRNCTFCHHNPGFFPASGNLSLTDGYSYDATVDTVSLQQVDGMLLIEPGSPEGSYLWHKINNTHIDQGGSGTGMPMGFFGRYERLSETDLTTIETWIIEGAQAN